MMEYKYVHVMFTMLNMTCGQSIHLFMTVITNLCTKLIVGGSNKLELYKQFRPRRVKNSHISEIEDSACVRNVMNITPVSGIEEVAWGAASILKTVNDGVYICACNVKILNTTCGQIMHLFMKFITNLFTKLNVVGSS